MREVYDGAAAYAQVAELFNKAATDFTAAAQLADPETDPTEMVTQPDKSRKAWHNSESHANQLSRLIDPLAAAAALAGVDGTDSDTTRLPLCVNVEGDHRRQLWTAWVRRDGRCNRWSALHQLGATIRALPDLEQHQVYAEPRPIEHRRVQVGRGEYRFEDHDPEDADYRPASIDPRRRQGRVTVV